jgi:hypothetical protein
MGSRATVAAALVVAAVAVADAQGRGGQAPAPPSTPRSAAPIDVTGQWVAVVTEDWRWRMVTPARGDYASVPLTAEAKRVADAWDPARDEAAGEQCRAYGAPGLMRSPTRLRISWLDADTLKLETDYGMQTRLFEFGALPAGVASSWQGLSRAQWVMPAGRRGAGPTRFGSMKSVTTRLRPGYLRKNGIPYSANAVLTEYWNVHQYRDGSLWLVVTVVVEDPQNLQMPWVTSLHFKKEADASKWDPTPCSARF